MDRRKTYFVSVPPSPAGTREALFSSPFFKGSMSRRQTLFETRPKDITFVMRGSLVTEVDDESDTPIKPLNFEEIDKNHSRPMMVECGMQTEQQQQQAHPLKSLSNAEAQTCQDVVDSCTQTTSFATTQPSKPSGCSVGVQTPLSSICDNPDHCVFVDLNASYLCQHRTNAVSASRKLDNVSS